MVCASTAETVRQGGRLSPRMTAVIAVAGSALLHLAVIGRVDLGVDEAHYALYGLKPALSYFDHPPLVGWLQALALMFGSSEALLRIWAVLLAAIAGGLVWRLTRALYPEAGERAAAAAVLLLQSALIFQVLSIGLVPELPLLVAGLAAGLLLHHAVGGGRTRDWLWLGLAFGLAGLSKYTAVTLVITAVGLVAWERHWDRLRSPGPWLAVLVALLCILPVLIWNGQHDWISLRYQLAHGAPDRAWEPARFAVAVAGQLLAYGPALVVFGLAAVAGVWRDGADRGARLSLLLGLPVLLLFAWAGGYEETLPHWTLLGWAALAPLAGRWLVRNGCRPWVRRVAVGGGVYAVGLILAIHGALFTPWLPFSAYRHPLGDLHGWDTAAERATALLQRLPATERGAVFVANWTEASRIAWYGRPARVRVLDSRFDQFDLWFGSPEAGDSGVLLARETRGEARLTERFEHCTQVDTVEPVLDGTPIHRFGLYHCRNYRG